MHLTIAQQFLLDICGEPKRATYKAPHAPQGTPPRAHHPRRQRFIFSKADNAMIPRVRLFKGHRK